MKSAISKRATLLLSLLGLFGGDAAGQWTPQRSNTTARFRAVSAVSPTVAWASGNNGTYARTTDGGATWRSDVVAGASALDFRDIHALDQTTAYLLSIGEGELSRIYKTTDGGRSWALQFTNRNPKAFYDAFAFWDANNGIAFSDPVEGRFPIIRTTDGGATWQEVPLANLPQALAGEAAFAASGSPITVHGKSNVWFGTGGKAARVFRSTDRGYTWSVAATPITSGEPSSGIFSLAFKDAENGVAVGGDYKKEAEAGDNVALTTDGGRTWRLARGSRLPGYRSAVAYAAGARRPALIAVGPSGTDSSFDGGESWTSIGKVGYHAVSFARPGGVGWAVGEGGSIAKYAGAASGSRSVTSASSRSSRASLR